MSRLDQFWYYAREAMLAPATPKPSRTNSNCLRLHGLGQRPRYRSNSPGTSVRR